MSWLLTIWAALGRTGRRALAALAVIGGVVAYHYRQVGQARKSGGEQERERINTETARKTKEIRNEASEIDRVHSDLSRDDLRGRMREQARDRDSA